MKNVPNKVSSGAGSGTFRFILVFREIVACIPRSGSVPGNSRNCSNHAINLAQVSYFGLFNCSDLSFASYIGNILPLFCLDFRMNMFMLSEREELQACKGRIPNRCDLPCIKSWNSAVRDIAGFHD